MAELSKAIARLMEERPPSVTDPPRVRAVLDRMRALVTPIERPLADAFARQLFGKSSADVLAIGDPQQWAAMTVHAFRFLSEPATSEPRVRVFNPDITRDGWDSPDTVVQTNMRDRPFIVDTIRECVQAVSGAIHRVLHPILAVERDAAGVLLTAGAPEVVGRHESFVHVEIERVADLAAVQATITARLADVIRATDDYPAMRAQVAAVAAALQAQRLPQPWNEDREEVAAFLDWLAKKSFVFLGSRTYDFSGQGTDRRGAVRPGSGLGILRDHTRSSLATAQPLPEGLRRRLNEPPLLIVSKTNADSPIHRRARMDYIGVKQIDPSGVVVGEQRFLGLFTAKAYADEAAELPLLRRKLEAILAREEAVPESHDYKTIVALFNSMPKEELFGSRDADLGAEIAAIRAAEGAATPHVVCRADALERGLFVVVMLPRDHFSSELYRRVAQRLQQVLNAALLHEQVALDEFERVRLHFYLGTPPHTLRTVTAVQLESELGDLLRTWDDRLTERLRRDMPAAAARQLAAKYLEAFSAEYRAATDIPLAVRDIRCLEAVAATRAPQIDITNETSGAAAVFTAVKCYLIDEVLVLSDFLPILENLGLTVFEEDHLDVPLAGVGTARIHTFLVQSGGGARLDVERLAPLLAPTLLALRAGQVENDPLNRLVVAAGLTWREVDALRAYVGHLQQTQVAAHELLVEAVSEHPEPARLLVEAFRATLDPAADLPPRERLAQALPPIEARFLASLDAVASGAHDRILRAAWATVAATVRTNFFVPPPAPGAPARAGHGAIAIKIESARLAHLPKPHPRYEIFVHAAHLAGIHLRSGTVARGGIRLSDRPDDFRTEVLGLMKTQTVKNAVIVPTGAKGGFVVKRRAAGTRAPQASVITAYRTLIGGLLDLTDNLVHGAVVHPPGVLCYDDSDPYLVVAADKGTATFSDTANEIAAAYGFWLGDAFASGGSHGYDHKQEGITAKGAWESVRQHFRALGRDADTESLIVIGIGDMSGDVFGNGLLRSPHLRLRAAFNHQHIFLDPDPDPATAFAERARLFALPRSGWNDYAAACISAGGGVYPRAAKTVPLSPPVRAMLGVDADSLSGEELIRAVLRMAADLLWNGGIGTYVKAHDESHAEVGDAANDAVRVDAAELRVQVVAEGGNLGFTQRARVEYALAGGRINTDAIDNSAGVDLSDHEVNLKIALGRAVESGALSIEACHELLAGLAPAVCEQVLADNRRQARALTLDQMRSRTRLNEFRELVAQLETEAQLDCQLERLPDRATLRARRGEFLGLTRPELAVVLAYSKLHLQHAVLQSSLPDDPYLERFFRRYFPAEINDRFGDGVRAHRLRREIIAVTLANWLIDSMGATFAARIARDTGSDLATVVKAWTAAVTIAGAEQCVDRLLAGTPPLAIEADSQCAAALEDSLGRATTWLVTTQPRAAALDTLCKPFTVPIATLRHDIAPLLPPEECRRDRTEIDALVGTGVPPALAEPLVSLRRTAELLDITHLATELGAPLTLVADVYYRVGGLVDLEWIRQVLPAAAGDDSWERRAVAGLSEGLVYARRQLARNILLRWQSGGQVQASLALYVEQHAAQLDTLRRLVNDIRSARRPTLAALVVVMRELGRLTGV